MHKERIRWAIVAVLVLGVAGLGYTLYSENLRTDEPSSSLSALGAYEAEPSAVRADGFETIGSESFDWDAKTVSFTHLCKGEVNEGSAFGDRSRSVSYCLGENRLEVKVGDGAGVVLLDEKVADSRYSPVLFGADLVPGNAKGTVLVSYTPEACTTVGDCGAGIPTNYVNYSYRLSDPSVGLKNLIKYPSTGVPVWNRIGTKALFVTDSCGGAGCRAVALNAFDLATDAVTAVTTEKAAPAQLEGFGKDANGRLLPMWGDCSWKDDTEFYAKIVYPDGTEKPLSGQVR